jgi:hypothetical protein
MRDDVPVCSAMRGTDARGGKFLAAARSGCHRYSSTVRHNFIKKHKHHAFSEPSTSTSAFLSPHRPPTRADIRSLHAPLERRYGGPSFLMLPTPAPRCPAHLICPNASLWVDSGRERLYPQKHAYVANPSRLLTSFLLLKLTVF